MLKEEPSVDNSKHFDARCKCAGQFRYRDGNPFGIRQASVHEIADCGANVFDLSPTRVLHVEVPKMLAISCASAKIWLEHHVPVLRQDQ